MPNFQVLNRVTRTGYKVLRLQKRIEIRQEAKCANTLNFFRKHFPGYSVYGYQIASVGYIRNVDKEQWQMIYSLVKTELAPIHTFAGRNVYQLQLLSNDKKDLISRMIGEGSTFTSIALIVFPVGW